MLWVGVFDIADALPLTAVGQKNHTKSKQNTSQCNVTK